MYVKKSGGKIFGANFTAAEKKAMNIEIQKYLNEAIEKSEIEIDAVILWELHDQLGFGKDRLKKFFMNFAPVLKELQDRYELEDSDRQWLFTYKLKELGIDMEAWEKEAYEAYQKYKNLPKEGD